ncbi:acyl-CoA dehydrogenase family protein [Streptacidiphilus sp. ASG 303]|uniref:acyl-CoA dehydrogenase family protein n=1 Tax=Streptacidiphilus sp. ASG 303 TaxID=2896847 RepID=UPI001E54171E|nr:acyl-CoA dehydrogenase family protein [Streptacidiphilus sp. ASG 303]MCD0486342.1 acyl-CoA dehydrogenase family protein [Streptacidiphilus sp. ASG 303]
MTTAVRRGGPRTATLQEGARTARDVARARADAVEAARALDRESAEALSAAGFARHFVPARYGGAEGGFADFAAAVAAVGEASASIAWCASVYAAMGRLGSHLPEEGRQELWQDGPDVRIAGSIAPAGRVADAPGGRLLSGEWTFASGVDHAAWVLLGAMAPAGEGRQYRFFAVPRRDVRIVDSWFNVGLRGTGSRTVVLDRVLVPPHRSFAQRELMAGAAEPAARCHTVPYKMVNGLNFVAPALGSARAGLRAWTSWIAGKTEVTGGATRDRGAVRLALSRSAAEIDLAQLLVERAARTADQAPPTPDVQVRNPLDLAVAAELLTAAVDRLFRQGGARGQAEGSELQRVWRDVNCAAGHAALQFDAAGDAYAGHTLAALTPRP